MILQEGKCIFVENNQKFFGRKGDNPSEGTENGPTFRRAFLFDNHEKRGNWKGFRKDLEPH